MATCSQSAPVLLLLCRCRYRNLRKLNIVLRNIRLLQRLVHQILFCHLNTQRLLLLMPNLRLINMFLKQTVINYNIRTHVFRLSANVLCYVFDPLILSAVQAFHLFVLILH